MLSLSPTWLSLMTCPLFLPNVFYLFTYNFMCFITLRFFLTYPVLSSSHIPRVFRVMWDKGLAEQRPSRCGRGLSPLRTPRLGSASARGLLCVLRSFYFLFYRLLLFLSSGACMYIVYVLYISGGCMYVNVYMWMCVCCSYSLFVCVSMPLLIWYF